MRATVVLDEEEFDLKYFDEPDTIILRSRHDYLLAPGCTRVIEVSPVSTR